jgi:hypothetical protein
MSGFRRTVPQPDKGREGTCFAGVQRRRGTSGAGIESPFSPGAADYPHSVRAYPQGPVGPAGGDVTGQGNGPAGRRVRWG